MNRETETLPTTTEELTILVLDLQAKLDQLSQFNNQLLEQIRLARHQHFGTRSERYSLEQLALAFNEAEAATGWMSENDSTGDAHINSAVDSIVVPAHLRKRGGRKPLPPELPRVDVIHRLDEAACSCESCSTELVVIGEKISEQLDITPARVQVIRHVKKTYACGQCQGKPTS
ncbi:MAG: IS66 family transposase, partial [Gammaproteobacteria bacterium]|nr:IS66 family transposase [Gammaproteobacteria bacterium]